MEICAACGKADVNLKICKACKLVKYCCVDCQVAHRPKHMKACMIREAALFEQKLFAQPRKREDCPICCLTLPYDDEEIGYMPCCGKFICHGCIDNLTREYCPYCNTPAAQSDREIRNMFTKRIEKYNDPIAMYNLGCFYNRGMNGYDIDDAKAVELFQRASELGSAEAHCALGVAYEDGRGVIVDREKSIHHYQMSAIMGNIPSRFKLGQAELKKMNRKGIDRALRHFMIGAKFGHDSSLTIVTNGFNDGYVTKEDFEITLREHKASKDETKSHQRDKAKATLRG